MRLQLEGQQLQHEHRVSPRICEEAAEVDQRQYQELCSSKTQGGCATE